MPNYTRTVKLVPAQDGKTWHTVQPVNLPPKEGPFLISFELTGAHAENVTFDKNDPIWVREGVKPDQDNNTHKQVPVELVTEDGKELVILDLNNNPETTPPLKLHYRLNFDGYDDLDPIIENGGGPSLVAERKDGVAWNSETIALALAAAVLLLLIGGLIGRMTVKR